MSTASPRTAGCDVRTNPRPGDLGRLTELHGRLYTQEYGWDWTFEALVAAELAEAVRAWDASLDRFWMVEREGAMIASIAIVHGAHTGQAQLRFFVVDPAARGAGLGRRLVRDALEFARAAGYDRIFLLTVSALGAAAHLYREAGFRCVHERTHALWGAPVVEQRYELSLE